MCRVAPGTRGNTSTWKKKKKKLVGLACFPLIDNKKKKNEPVLFDHVWKKK